MTQCSVVIVTYNSSRVIEKCLSPLLGHDDIQIVVVDNASTDDTTRILQNNAGITVVRNEENAGFARAVNEGVRHASGRFILLLNPDAVVNPGDLNRLAESLEAHQEWGVIAPVLASHSHPVRTLNAGLEPSLWRIFTHMSGLSKITASMPALERILGGHYFYAHNGQKAHRNADWVSGGCMMIRRSVWERSGGLSTRWFMYAEDIEFCHRVRSLGASVVLDTSVEAIHDVGGSSLNVDGKLGTLWLTNLYDYYRLCLAKSRLESDLWVAVARSGFYLRHLASRILAVASMEGRDRSGYNARRFLNYARFSVPPPQPEYPYPGVGRTSPDRSGEGAVTDVTASEGPR